MSSKTIYLYLKTHNKTGLKYLGKTVQDPHKYRGSGIVWRRHLEKHGDDITTNILLATKEENDIREKGLFFSRLWNVVESKEFANLCGEQGQGGYTASKEKVKQTKIIKGNLGVNNAKKMVATRRKNGTFAVNADPEVIAKINKTKQENKKKVPGWGKQSPETIAKRIGKKRGPYKKNHTCPDCGQAFTLSSLKQHNCNKAYVSRPCR